MTLETAAPAKVTDDETLGSAWQNFGAMLIEPWNLLLLLGVGCFFYISQKTTDPSTSAVVQVLLTIGSGVLGGRLAKKMGSMTEGSVLRARGRSAVRSLKLLLRNTSALEARVNEFILRREHIDSEPEVTVRNYEEIVVFCRLLQEETVSSIENWTDIVSEADISSIMGVISDLKATIDAKQEELTQLKVVQESTEFVSGERDRLAIELGQKSAELITLRGRLQRAATGISSSTAYEAVNRLAGLTKLSGGLSMPTISSGLLEAAKELEKNRAMHALSEADDDTLMAR